MFNSKNLGALIVDEDPHVKSWEDGQYNILNMSVEETFGLGILQEGQAIAVAKNVKIRPNEFVMTAPYEVPSSLAATSLAHTRGPAGDQAAPGVAINAQLSPARGWLTSSSATMPATARSSSSMGLWCCALSGFLWCCLLRDGFLHKQVGSMVPLIRIYLHIGDY